MSMGFSHEPRESHQPTANGNERPPKQLTRLTGVVQMHDPCGLPID